MSTVRLRDDRRRVVCVAVAQRQVGHRNRRRSVVVSWKSTEIPGLVGAIAFHLHGQHRVRRAGRADADVGRTGAVGVRRAGRLARAGAAGVRRRTDTSRRDAGAASPLQVRGRRERRTRAARRRRRSSRARTSRQAPPPLQVPSVPQVAAPWSVHWFSRILSAPGPTAQVPTVPASAHDAQVPGQARRAADALRAEVRVAQSFASRAGLAVGELAAAAASTQLLGDDAVGVDRCRSSCRSASPCRRRTDRTATLVTRRGRRRRRRTSAAASASIRRTSPAAHCVPAAQKRQAPVPLHIPSRPAGRRRRRRALRGRRGRGAVGDVAAGPDAAGDRARLARPGAGLVAADALRAEAGVALVRRRARGADRLQRADVRVADVGRDAVRVGRAGRPARARGACRRCTCRTGRVVAAAQRPAPSHGAAT